MTHSDDYKKVADRTGTYHDGRTETELTTGVRFMSACAGCCSDSAEAREPREDDER